MILQFFSQSGSDEKPDAKRTKNIRNLVQEVCNKVNFEM